MGWKNWRKRRRESDSDWRKRKQLDSEALDNIDRRADTTLQKLLALSQWGIAYATPRIEKYRTSVAIQTSAKLSNEKSIQISKARVEELEIAARDPSRGVFARLLDLDRVRRELRKAKAELADLEWSAQRHRRPATDAVMENALREEERRLHHARRMNVAVVEEISRRQDKAARDAADTAAEKSAQEALKAARAQAAAERRAKVKGHQKEELRRLRAIAASVAGKSRERADELKSVLRRQLLVSPNCPYCAATISEDTAHLDHIFPISKGGLSVEKNLVYVCSDCNEAKAALTLATFIKQRKLDRSRVEMTLEELGKEY